MHCDSPKMKISFEKRFFSWNRILLLAAGLWPHQQSMFVQLQVALFLGILISLIIFQLSRLFLAECTFDFAIKSLCVALLFSIFTGNYVIIWSNIETMKYLLKRLRCIYNALQDNNEIAIYDKYGGFGKRMTITCIIAEICCLFTAFLLQAWAYIFDIISPNNKTYVSHARQILCKHFAIQERYFPVLALHMSAASLIGSLTTIAGATLIFSYIIHIWGMFRISSYRVEQSIKSNALKNNMLNDDSVIYKWIICAVDIHREAMEFITLILQGSEGLCFVIIIINVFCVTCNLYQICQFDLSTEEVEETIANFIIMVFVLMYMFLGTYVGQEIINHNNDIFFTAYNCPWYLAPLHIQKLILFLLQRGNKAFTMNIGGVFTLSLECFSSLASATLSYLTVMLSLK